ncbi:hypothetical protein H4W01_001439 [Sphingomonas sp. PL20]
MKRSKFSEAQIAFVLKQAEDGTTIDNAFFESFNGKFWTECLNQHWFMSLDDAVGKCETWLRMVVDALLFTRSALAQRLTNIRLLPMRPSSCQRPEFGSGQTEPIRALKLSSEQTASVPCALSKQRWRR